MCGVTGYWSKQRIGREKCHQIARNMADKLFSRGPDDSGVWLDEVANLALAHRRLSILDLSPAGHQPMSSASGRFVIVFNGEIYNHTILRKELDATGCMNSWRGHSDTETLLAAIELWGLHAALQKCTGMFAIALWDRKNRTLTLGRDRLGEKPLYFGRQKDVLLFGSELKALKAHPVFEGEVDRDALALYMRHSYVPAPYSIYKGIRKLEPGCLVTFSSPTDEPLPVRYWHGRDVIEVGQSKLFQGSLEEASDRFELLLKNAIAQQMVADVPFGAFLSGGVDSSTIVALMHEQSSIPVRTFTIGFHEASYNEAKYAKAIARHLGTEHTELYVTAQQALDTIPKLPQVYCEPFADNSQIPTYLISQLASQQVKVALSGDAGDELLGGYKRYEMARSMWRALSLVPVPLRRLLAACISSIPSSAYNQFLGSVKNWLPHGLGKINIGDKLHKGARVMSSRSPVELYLQLVSLWSQPEALVLGSSEPVTVLTDYNQQPNTEHLVEKMMSLDMLTYLPDDILCKVDRAAMANSLETRIPLLDHRVVEFVWRLPLQYKMHDGVSKWLLRQLLYKYVPKKLIERPKMGFGIPVDIWLRGPLREWAENLLNEGRLQQEGYFNHGLISQKWKEHLSGQHNWQNHLWCVLMFQAWLTEQRS